MQALRLHESANRLEAPEYVVPGTGIEPVRLQ